MSEVAICNQALSWLGGNPITSLDDKSKEAQLCKANYALLRDAVLEDREWTFAIEWLDITPLLAAPVNLARWSYQFLLDPKVLRVVEVVDLNDNPITYVKEGRYLKSSNAEMLIRCIVQIVDTTYFSPNFGQALAARLAADIAIPLTENRSLQADMFKLYGQKLLDGITTDSMQGSARRVRSNWVRNSR